MMTAAAAMMSRPSTTPEMFSTFSWP